MERQRIFHGISRCLSALPIYGFEKSIERLHAEYGLHFGEIVAYSIDQMYLRSSSLQSDCVILVESDLIENCRRQNGVYYGPIGFNNIKSETIYSETGAIVQIEELKFLFVGL